MPNTDGTPTPEELAQKQEAEAATKVKADADAKAEEEKKKALDSETTKKELHLQNINKAIEEAEEDLRQKREAKKAPVDTTVKVEETVPQIDDNAPEAKAWNNRIKENTDPLVRQNEAEKAEIRKFALSEFLADKPALAADPTKVKELMDVYGRIATNTGKTKEGVLLDLKKAFGAVYSEQLITAAKSGRIDKAKELAMFSDPAIDKGATGYADEKDRMPNLSAEDRAQLAKWGMTPEDWWASQGKKV